MGKRSHMNKVGDVDDDDDEFEDLQHELGHDHAVDVVVVHADVFSQDFVFLNNVLDIPHIDFVDVMENLGHVEVLESAEQPDQLDQKQETHWTLSIPELERYQRDEVLEERSVQVVLGNLGQVAHWLVVAIVELYQEVEKERDQKDGLEDMREVGIVDGLLHVLKGSEDDIHIARGDAAGRVEHDPGHIQFVVPRNDETVHKARVDDGFVVLVYHRVHPGHILWVLLVNIGPEHILPGQLPELDSKALSPHVLLLDGRLHHIVLQSLDRLFVQGHRVV